MGLLKAKSADTPAEAPPKEKGGKPPLRARLKAWWEGYELEAPEPEEAPPAEETDAFPAMEAVPPLEEPMVQLLMAIWGEGCSKPGDSGYYLMLTKPFALNENSNLLDFSCGLGSGARAIAKEFNISVAGVDGDRTMVDAGTELSAKLEIGKRVVISHFNPKSAPLKTSQYDCILCVDRMHTILAKSDTLAAMAAALKGRGQVVITDIILADGVAADDKRLTTILGDGASRSQFWSLVNYQKAFKEQKFELKESEDIGETYRKLVTDAWAAFTRNPAAQGLSRTIPKQTVAEAEYWQRLLVAMDAGLLRVYRFHAIKQ